MGQTNKLKKVKEGNLMMKVILQIFIAIQLVLVAVTSALAGGGLTPNTIDTVAFQTGGFFLYADGWPNPNSCTRSSAIVLLDTDSNYDKAYGLLLAAFISGKKVSGYSDGCATFDGQTYNTIRGFKYLKVSE
jgi:hypothetical protein